MKIDMDLIRAILLKAEEDIEINPQTHLGPYTEDVVAHHCWLVWDGKLVRGRELTSVNSKLPKARVQGLTWEGHQFLNSVRDPGVWAKTKQRLGPLGSWTVDVIKEVAVEFSKDGIRDILGG